MQASTHQLRFFSNTLIFAWLPPLALNDFM
jgi:hypothetical protein